MCTGIVIVQLLEQLAHDQKILDLGASHAEPLLSEWAPHIIPYHFNKLQA